MIYESDADTHEACIHLSEEEHKRFKNEEPIEKITECARGRFKITVHTYKLEEQTMSKNNESAVTVKELLQAIHDEADHIIGTEAENKREVVVTNAKQIKSLSLEALKNIEKENRL